MKTINTCEETEYSPLIPAIVGLCTAQKGESLKIIMNNAEAFSDLKTYLSKQKIGFREIYDESRMTVEFIVL